MLIGEYLNYIFLISARFYIAHCMSVHCYINENNRQSIVCLFRYHDIATTQNTQDYQRLAPANIRRRQFKGVFFKTRTTSTTGHVDNATDHMSVCECVLDIIKWRLYNMAPASVTVMSY